MSTPIASVQGLNPYFLGTDTPVGVDDTGTAWAVSFQGRNAILTATFASGVSVQFQIPTTSTASSKAGSVASFDIPNFGSASWTTYAQHVKFEVRFPTPPKVTNVSVNIARQSTTLVSDGNGGVDVLSNGVKVGALPRPFLDYTPDGATGTTRVWLDWVVADPTMTLSLPTTLTASEWATAVLDPTVITTSTASTATAYSNQRKLDRTQNGVLWAMYWDGTSNTTSSMRFRYSTDNGATWTDGGGFGFTGTGTTYVPNGSLFIDVDDYAHVVHKDRSDGYLYYRRGTPNAGRTAWTWGAAKVLDTGTTGYDVSDLVAHPEGTGWKAHIVYSDTTPRAYYRPITLASDGTPTVGSTTLIGNHSGAAVTVHTYPSIDFHHTGDGKTVAGGTPHLYAAWSAGTTGAGYGIRFKKAAYSGGAWTWGTEREIDSTRYVDNGDFRWLNCLFDGTQVVIAGTIRSSSAWDTMLYERDAADTTTITHPLITPVALNADSTAVFAGSVTYDSSGNVYFVYGDYSTTAANAHYRKWDRATDSLGAATTIGSSANPARASAKRGYSNSKIECVYTDGTASPYSVTYGSISLGISATLPVATETDTPQALNWSKAKALPVAVEADAAQALGRLKVYVIAPAAETDQAMLLSTGIRVFITPASETDAALPLGVKFTDVFYTFAPPVTWERMPTNIKPFSFYRQEVSFAVVMRNGHFQSVRTPSQDETDKLVEGRTWFTGGRSYTVDQDVATLLQSDGFEPVIQ